MDDRPLLIDLFCCQGGASKGYHDAGFRVIGVDINPQPRYPFEFIQGDVFEVWDSLPHDEAVAYAASPPCQAYSATKSLTTKEHPDLIKPTRELLLSAGKPYIMENVAGAPLAGCVLLLRGTMFEGLRVIRHRYFENNINLWVPPRPCNHWGTCSGGTADRDSNGNRIRKDLTNYDFLTVVGNDYIGRDGAVAMGIDWMTKTNGLSQAIPPAYTEYIGGKLMMHLKGEVVV